MAVTKLIKKNINTLNIPPLSSAGFHPTIVNVYHCSLILAALSSFSFSLSNFLCMDFIHEYTKCKLRTIQSYTFYIPHLFKKEKGKKKI